MVVDRLFDALADACVEAGLRTLRRNRSTRPSSTRMVTWPTFVGGRVALAWSRFDAEVRDRVRKRYLEAIAVNSNARKASPYRSICLPPTVAAVPQLRKYVATRAMSR